MLRKMKKSSKWLSVFCLTVKSHCLVSKKHTEEHSSVSPDLSPMMASTKTSESDVSIAIFRRLNSHICNDMFLQSFLSDPTPVDGESTPVDDGSDDDSRHQNPRRFAYGEKRPACTDYITPKPKPDNEEFESLTPSSESTQQSPMDTSSKITSIHPATMEYSPLGSDHELETPQNPTRDKISLYFIERSENKSVHQDLK